MGRLVGKKTVETSIDIASGSIPIYNKDYRTWETINLSEVTGSVFPFTGSAVISGSLTVSGTTNLIGDTGTTVMTMNTDTMVFTGSFITTGSIENTGSLTVYGTIGATSITSSLLGTASYAVDSLSGSYAVSASHLIGAPSTSSQAFTASYVSGSNVDGTVSSSYTASIADSAYTASYVNNAQTASYVLNAFTASYISGSNVDGTVSSSYTASIADSAYTASYILNAVSSSYAEQSLTASHALTASSADNLLVRNVLSGSDALFSGTITAQTIHVQTVSSSVVYSTGSNKLGSLLTDTQQLTGSVGVTGSLTLNNVPVLTADQTGSFTVATASFAFTASYIDVAQTASYVINAFSASYISGSNVNGTVSSSYSASIADSAYTASYVDIAQTASYVVNAFSASYISGSNVEGTVSSSYTASIADNAYTASYVTTAQTASYVVNAFSSSYVSGSDVNGTVSSSYTASIADNATSASYALTASYAANVPTSASYALEALSASYAATASSADTFFVRNVLSGSDALFTGTITAQSIHVETVSSSVVYSTGSNKLGSLQSDVQQLTGSVGITGSLIVSDGITGNLLGTASTASYVEIAVSASYVSGSNVVGTVNSSFSASLANNALTASYVSNAVTASYISTASYALDSNLLDGKDSSVFATTGSNFFSGNQVVTGSVLVDGDVGVKITNPSASLHVAKEFNKPSLIAGDLVLQSSVYSPDSSTISSNVYFDGLEYRIIKSGYGQVIFLQGDTMVFSVGTDFQISGSSFTGNQVLALTGSYVGVNITDPEYNLDVHGNGNFTEGLIVTGSILAGNITSSLFGTASYALDSNLLDGKDSETFATTGSNLYSGSQTIYSGFRLYTDAVENYSGNILNLFGDVKFNGNDNSVANNLNVTGSLYANSITGSLLGTASYANSSLSASYAVNSTSASAALYANNATSASYAATASSADSFVVRNSFTASGLRYPTADNGVESFIQTDGAGNLSLQYVKTLYQNIRNVEAVTIQKGTPLYVSGSTRDNANVYIADAGNPNRMPATLIAGDTLASAATGRGIILGHIEGVNTTGYPAGTLVYVGIGGGWTATRPTGSTIEVQPLGVVTREGTNGMGIVLTVPPNNLPNISAGYTWVGNGNGYPQAVTTASFNVASALLAVTASYAINANLLDNKPASYFASTGSNSFTGNQTISGSLVVSGSTTILQNLTVLGTASYNYVTASSLLVTDNWITVTTTGSIGRFGGLKVTDYEGTGDTASFAWDVIADRWLEIAPTHDTYSSSLFLMGPKNTGSLGDETGLTPNFIPRAEDEHHLVDSGISDDGTYINLIRGTVITGSLDVTQGISGSFFGTSSWSQKAVTASYALYADAVGTIVSGAIVTTGSNIFIGDQTISGSTTITGNLTVYGTSSFVYVTASQLFLTASFLSLNIFEPAERFGGIIVYDSGSLGHEATASLAWDSLKNHWVYQNASGSMYSGGMLISGPRNSGSLGDEPSLTSGRIPKSVGGDHIDNSIMSEVSGSIGVSGSIKVTGSIFTNESAFLNNNTGVLTGGNQILVSTATGSFTSAFYNYTLASGSNARAGQFIVVWNGTSINYTDVSTTDIGVTSNFNLTASLSGNNVDISSVVPSNNWVIKTTVNLL